MDKEQQALLKLHLTPQLGRTALFKLHDYFGDFNLALEASAKSWQSAGLGKAIHSQLHQISSADFDRIRDKIDSLKIQLLSFWDEGYPQLLRNIHDPPALIYLRGTLPELPCFAIVGSRRASNTGLRTTRDLAAELARHDICIVSGLARGIDSAAHQGALDTNGSTIAVLGCGIDRIYPPDNTRLYFDILKNNAILSEYPPGVPPAAGHFPGRNRIISGLSHGVLIVEAAEKSGSLITGDFALEQGRELFAVPGNIRSNNSQGTNRLLKEGAQIVTEAADILHLLWPQRLSRQEKKQQLELSEQLPEPALAVYQLLGETPLHSDEIARKCSLTPMELSAILLDLELRGGIKTLPGNHYVRE